MAEDFDKSNIIITQSTVPKCFKAKFQILISFGGTKNLIKQVQVGNYQYFTWETPEKGAFTEWLNKLTFEEMREMGIDISKVEYLECDCRKPLAFIDNVHSGECPETCLHIK